MDFKSFMLERVDGEFNFLPAEGVSEGRNSPSTKSMNNVAPMIDATPLSSVYPSNIVENVADSNDPSYGEDEQTLVGPSLPHHPEVSKKLKILGKRKVPSGVLKKALPSKVVAHVTPSSWKQHLREISIEQLCDIHDRAYIRQAVLDNVLNTRELDKDRAYAELERRCNEALQNLDKNPLVFDMRAEIKALQGQVDGFHSEYSRLILEEKKWVIGSLKQDRVAVFSKVIPDAAMKLVRSDDLGVVRSDILLEEYDQAGDALANASYPFLAEYVVNPYASLERLLSKKPPGFDQALSGSRPNLLFKG
ncbi:hypothetical protein Tco_0926714 [Tanacetum coccineum]|uniref:Uncharacterized protein n=1 Tax=Tanacetum coccineum TaxID=301880 RepID=A0ABQ5DBL3_9ASTR